MGLPGMEVQRQFARGLWEREVPPTALSLGCKRLHPVAPTAGGGGAGRSRLNSSNFKIFIKPQASRDSSSSDSQKSPHSSPQSDAVQQSPISGPGTRWNPTQEQISILETLYGGGMRTPNAQQIEHITAHLAMYGRIEGKNVFYWFQNHKARERQKQKRTTTTTTTTTYHNNNASSSNHIPDYANCELSLSTITTGESGSQQCKRKRMVEEEDEEELGQDRRTLALFPVAPGT